MSAFLQATSSLGRYMNHADMTAASFDAGTHACNSNPNPIPNPDPTPTLIPEPTPEPWPGADACNSILVPQNAELYHTCLVQMCRFLPEASKREDLPPPPAEGAVLARQGSPRMQPYALRGKARLRTACISV